MDDAPDLAEPSDDFDGIGEISRERARIAAQLEENDRLFTRAIAAAYEESASEPAVFAGARRKGIQSAGPDIRKALDDNNYLLANQIVLAYAVVSGEQQKWRTRKRSADRLRPRQTLRART